LIKTSPLTLGFFHKQLQESSAAFRKSV